MGTKKDEYRFTIQFSPTDPRHKPVVEILNRQGRRKAQYLVNAVLCYENGTEAATPGQPSSYQMIEAIVNQILAEKTVQKNQQSKQLLARRERKVHQSEEITFEDAALELGQEGLSAIADSIAAFRKKQ